MRLRLPLIATAVASILAMSAGSVLAIFPGTPDAAQIAFDTNLPAPAEIQVQTFVPGISGSLVAVYVHTNTFVPPPPPQVVGPAVVPNVTTNVTVAIFPTTAGGFPTGSFMASQVVTPLDPGWTVVTFTHPTDVVAGTKYALELAQGATDTTLWDFACADNYGPGTPYILDGSWKTIFQYSGQDCLADFAFQTFIVAPAIPSAPPPVTTVPPTSTTGSGSGQSSSDAALLLVLVGLGSAAVFASVARSRLIQR